jgi:tetratricopeptide (TPR) repeat protein
MVKERDHLIGKARRFISGGVVKDVEPESLAKACDRLVRLEIQRSPQAAITLAKKLVRRAGTHQGILLRTSLTVLGVAQLAAGRYKEARNSILEARKLALRDPDSRARLDRILIDVCMYLADLKEATRRYRTAVSTFERLGNKTEVAKTRVNYASLLYRQDRHREAGRQYRQAIRILESTSDKLSLAICRYNLANTLVQSMDLDEAAQLFLQAERGLTDLGYDLYANECRYGVAWLRMLHGDYHLALSGLTDCQVFYERAGQAKGVVLCQLDRAEIYQALNLFTDARNASRSAEKTARRLGIHYETAKAALYLARALLAIGDKAGARKALKRAAVGFKRERNDAFLGVVELTSALVQSKKQPSSAALALARKRFTKAQVPLWEAISDLEYLQLYPDSEAPRKRLARNAAVKVVPHLCAAWHTILGDRLHAKGRLAAARKHWMQAAEMLDAVRVQLPPTEVRSLLSRQRNDPYLRLVSLLCEGNPADAAVWSERHRTAGLWTPLSDDKPTREVRRGAKKKLSSLAQELGALSARIVHEPGKRSTAHTLQSRRVEELQRQVRGQLSRLELTAGRKAVSHRGLLSDFRKTSKRLPVIQFQYEGEDILAFIHNRGGTVFHRYRDGRRIVREFSDFWQLLIGRAIQASGRSRRRDLDDEQRLFEDFGSWLLGPVRDLCAGEELLILPEGELSNIPWLALVLDKRPLFEMTGVVIAPSLRHYVQATTCPTPADGIEVFVGDTQGLSSCEEELDFLSTASQSAVEIHYNCRRNDWPDRQDRRIWHYLGHARFRSDNPFYSSLQMADGPLFAADFRLMRSQVGLVTLAACRTGQQTFVPGEESTGLVRSLLDMGARNVIASHWAVADRSAACWMRTFYQSYLSNLTLHRSIRDACEAVRERFPSAYHWAAFALFGAGLNKEV